MRNILSSTFIKTPSVDITSCSFLDYNWEQVVLYPWDSAQCDFSSDYPNPDFNMDQIVWQNYKVRITCDNWAYLELANEFSREWDNELWLDVYKANYSTTVAYPFSIVPDEGQWSNMWVWTVYIFTWNHPESDYIQRIVIQWSVTRMWPEPREPPMEEPME